MSAGPPFPPAAPPGPYLSPDGAWWWDGTGWRPTYGWYAAPPGAGPLGVPRRPPGFAAGAVLTLLGVAALVVGSVLPWASLSLGFTTVSQSGTGGGDGWFFIGAGAALAVLAFVALSGRAGLGIALPILLIGVATAALLGFEFNDAHNIISRVRSDTLFSDTAVSYGSGLYVLAVGVAAVIAGGALEWMRHARTLRG